MRLGDGPGAELDYKRVIELDPTSADAWAILASSQLLQGKLDVAEQTYRTAVKLEPHSYEALSGLGSIAYKRRDICTRVPFFRITYS